MKRYAKEAGISERPEHQQFEAFAGSVLLRAEVGHDPETSIDDFLAGDGIQGYDLFATVINDELVTDVIALQEICVRARTLRVEFVFAQFKTSPSFKTSDFSNFVDTCKMIIKDSSVLDRREFPSIELVSAVYDKAEMFKFNPKLSLFYVTTSGVGPELPVRRKADSSKSDIAQLSLTSAVDIRFFGAPALQARWRQLDQGTTRTIRFEKKASMPQIDGVVQAYIGMLPAEELLKLVTVEGSPTRILKSVFYDNVRDFQGNVDVNSKISETLTGVDRARFAVFNNGVTIVAQEINNTGDTFRLLDYQVVNGCQTVHVLHEAAMELGGIDSLTDVFVPVKMIATSDVEVARSIAQATNQQTQVTAESLLANSEVQKRIEEYFTVIDDTDDYKLYYERRLKQWAGSSVVVGAWRLVTIRQMIRSFGSVYLNQPHTATRYYNDLRDQAGSRIFIAGNAPALFWVSALLFCRIEFLFRNDKIDAKLKPVKFHMMSAISRSTLKGNVPHSKNSVAVEKYIADLRSLLASDERLIKAISICADVAVRHSATALFDRDFCRTQESATKYSIAASRRIRMEDPVLAKQK
ncbi:AIPR family protein [Rhodococcus sp. H36-A4]|uniref:AIPR family protein n=1 Tax=Rhodococcus sp. H36-A4 TaxID=3004353 RepID=UPI0022AF7D92|nr:AIPR family protein [Rhodococcus sp. H36-A4]MCZ4080296.1 AIPR family protein [Rhodococcus sp. H36-A4]